MIVDKLGDGNGIDLLKELMINHKDDNEVIHILLNYNNLLLS